MAGLTSHAASTDWKEAHSGSQAKTYTTEKLQSNTSHC